MHAEDDQIVPIDAAGRKSAALLADATPKVYPGGSHGLVGQMEQAFNADLPAFLKS